MIIISSVIVSGLKKDKPIFIMLFGLGKLTTMSHTDKREAVRRALGLVIRAAESYNIGSLAIALPEANDCGYIPCELVQESSATALIAHYKFLDFITDPDAATLMDITMTLCVDGISKDECAVGMHHGDRIGYAVNQARHWCDLPGNHITPTSFAQRTERIAASHGLKFNVINKTQMLEMGMGGLCAVSQGSSEEPKLVIVEYHCGDDKAPTIGLVGKGITFDSGGLSLKPANAMETMKDDMAGAAVVMCTIEAIAHLKPHVNIIAFAPLAENMPSGSATRPGDIIKFYNGVTAEVNNTDAEGRLVLADALAYAVKQYKLDALIDLATLTGACSYALGPFYAGLMSQHDELAHQLVHASERSGDRVWRLPMHNDYKAAIKTPNADISNTGNERYRAGAVTAAFFLKNFVGNVPWAHLDIAGTAFNVPDISYYRTGATGFGVRLLVDLIMHWGK
ncbi:MAG: leucyl aminopeptidase [Gammaproteobacteria bacterium]|nr:leucyl aminopeptidase [Gammaproteobacteria bacterium]